MVLADSHRISRVLWYLGVYSESQRAFAYRAITFYGLTFQNGSANVLVCNSPALRRIDPATPPHASVLGFRLFPFRSPLLRESRFLSLPGGTEMSHFPPLASFRLFYSADDDGTSSRRVSPFGHPRVEDYLRLTEAYRSLSRPSSPSRAKASTMHP